MDKNIIKTFIQKYHLGGTIESVKFVVDDTKKTIRTDAITDDKNVLLSVVASNFTYLQTAELGINDTSKLLKLLSVLGDEVECAYVKHSDKITSIIFNDKNADVQYVTADLSVIPAAPPLKKVPPFNVEIKLDEQFVSGFIAAKAALSDATTFTLLMNKKKSLEFVLGYSSLNTNRIKLNVSTNDGKDAVSRNISFNADHFKQILSANRDCKDAIFKVSDGGLGMIEFASGDFVSTYYIVENKSVD